MLENPNFPGLRPDLAVGAAPAKNPTPISALLRV